MLLDALMLMPYVAIAASLFLVGTVATVCAQFLMTPHPVGFGLPTERRRVSYRGAVKTVRKSQLQEAA